MFKLLKVISIFLCLSLFVGCVSLPDTPKKSAQYYTKHGIMKMNIALSFLSTFDKEAYAEVTKPGLKGLFYALAKMHIAHGWSIDRKYVDVTNRTLLIMAAFNNDLKCVQFCIDNKADVNAFDDNGETALHGAAADGNAEIAKLLIKNKADINFKSKAGFTPFIQAAYSGNVKIMQVLLEKGADINAKCNNGLNAFIWACINGKKDAAQFLIKNKADTSRLYIVLAASAGLNDQVQKFIKNGQDVNQKSSSGSTPLIMAAKFGHNDTVKLLLKNKADINAKDNEGYSALLHAIMKKQGKTAVLLIESGSDKSEFKMAMILSAAYGLPDAVKTLYKKGIEIDCRDDDGRTLLMYACQQGNLDIVKFLVENKASLTERDKTLNGQTPLMTAAFNMHPSVVKYLISKGADINAMKNDGWSIINIAVQAGSLEVIKHLVENGADKESKLQTGATPLFLAIWFNHFDIFKYLVDKGADIKAADARGATILDHAKDFYQAGKIDEEFYNYVVAKSK